MASLFVCAAESVARPLESLLGGRLPIGGVSVLEGDPGTSKSLLTCCLAACISRGLTIPHCGDSRPSAGVVFLNAEDDFQTVTRPRLESAGADLSRIFAYDRGQSAS